MGDQNFFYFIFLFRVLINPCCSISFRNFLDEKEYAAIGISGCSISAQKFIGDRFCAYHMTVNYPSDPTCEPFFPVLYVPVEPESVHPPKILLVFKKEGRLGYRLIDIDYPAGNKTIVHSFIPNHGHTYFSNLAFNHSSFDFIGVTYNHLSGFLYIIYEVIENKKQQIKADVYLMKQNFSSKSNSLLNTFILEFDVDKFFVDAEWSSDIYTNMFYYHKIHYSPDHGYLASQIYSIPFDSFTYYLKHGIRGKLEKDFGKYAPQRKHVQVTNGLIYSVGARQNTSFLSSLHGDVRGFSCHTDGSRTQDNFFVLTGWELCKIRDGEKANFTSCKMQTSEVSTNDSMEKQNCSSSGFVWAITLGIIVNAIILMIILCVLCKRKNVKKYDGAMYFANNNHDEVFCH